MLNVPVFAVTRICAGAVNAGDALLVNVTTATPTGAMADKVTVQTVLPLEDKVVAEQESPLTEIVTCKDTVVCAVPFRVAVRVAV